MSHLKELDAFTIDDWNEVFENYFMSKMQVAELLHVSVSRIFQYESQGYIHSVVKGYYLKTEIHKFQAELDITRKRFHRKYTAVSTEQIFKLFMQIYDEKQMPITPKEVIERANELEGSEKVLVKYRVTSAIHLLVKGNKIKRVNHGQYVPA